MSDIIILHFRPLALYPPAINILRELSRNNFKVLVLTTTKYNKKIEGINILALSSHFFSKYKLLNKINYIIYNLVSTFIIIFNKPKTLFYFEEISSLPAFLIKSYIFKSLRIYIHYHEYFSEKEFEKGMRLVRIFHNLEKKLYEKAAWISHTNKDRLDLFKEDNGLLNDHNLFVLPNYPPFEWYRKSFDKKFEYPIKFLYVGVLSNEGMYFENFFNWIMNLKGKAKLEIYSHNMPVLFRDDLMKLDSKCEIIKYCGSLEYDKIPEVAKNFNIGLILYKGLSKNTKYSVPNKLFEYYACGIDVWFPKELKSCHNFITSNSRPRILSIDYNQLDNINLEDFMSTTIFHQNKFAYQDALKPLINKLNNEIYNS